MKNRDKRGGFTPQEHLISSVPAILVGVFFLLASIATALLGFPAQSPLEKILLLACGILGSLQLSLYYFGYSFAIVTDESTFTWINTALAGVTLCAIGYLLPADIKHLIYILVFVFALPPALSSDNLPAHALVIGVAVIHCALNYGRNTHPYEWVTHVGFTLTALLAVETIQQLKKVAARRIKRLEIINELSKQIVSTLESRQVFALLNAALQNALEADAYYIGTVHGDQLHLELLYDDGEYFQDLWVNKKGTLCNWVITHQQGLFLPDLRNKIDLEDVETVTVGKDKPTLSWMGAPMRASHVEGAIAISSYRPNAFDRSDMELLNNIAQRAAFALDNAHHHAQVERQAQLDSLTEVYNHGYFIKALMEQAQTCQGQNQPLSLIMLDIDHFKLYNDTFGHLIGDEVLISLCNVIRQHVKSTDAVGRWGGEEFCISLPNADEGQALQVAQRIRESMASLKVKDREQLTIPVPTVSQGIAVFPAERDDIIKLIDLADERLYRAKKRGRDQVESASTLTEVGRV
jgi:diguanylate cyclase (GGDEF)-like protein